MTRLANLAVLFAAILSMQSNLVKAADVTSTYSGADANWSTAAWVNVPPLGGFPNNGNAGVATYDAIFSGGSTLTLDQDITIQKLTLGNGTITGTFSLTTNDVLHDSGGAISGNGITNANGGMQIDGAFSYLDTRTLNIGGATSFTGSAPSQLGYLYMSNGAVINNSGTFDAGWALNFDNNIALYAGTTPTFNNTGTFTRSIGSSTTTVSVPFNNSNIVTVQAGTLVLSGGGTETGSFQVASGATLIIGGTGTTFAAGSGLSGLGTVKITGTATITAPALTYSGGGSLLLTGTLNGDGTLTATSPIHVTGGVMSGTGITNANGGLSIDGVFNYLDMRTLNIGGATSFTGSAPSQLGYLYVSNGAVINNSGTFDAGWSLNYDNYIALYTGTTPTFNNSGTFTRSVGNGTTTISIPFNNSNIVNVQAGTLLLNGGGMETGSFEVASGATLTIGGTGTTFAAGSSLSGLGTLKITGTATVTAPALTYSGGGSLLLTGTLDGSGTLTATSPIHVAGGVMSGTGITNANGGLQIGGAFNYLDTRTLNIGGATSFTGGAPSQIGYLYLSNGAVINNSGTFDAGWSLNYDNYIALYTGTTPTFNNSGTFTRSVGNGTTTVSIPFNNSNIVNVQAGTLLLNGGGMETGSFQVASGATLTIAGTGTTFAAGSSLSGLGTLKITGTATVTAPAMTYSGSGSLLLIGTLNGGGTLTATSAIHVTGGVMSGTGITNANGGLTIDGVFSYLDMRTLNIGGAASFTGSAASQIGYLYVSNGAVINNSGTFDAGWSLNYDNYIYLYTGTTPTFDNSGTFTRSVGNGKTTVSIPFSNTGIVDVKAGTLEFDNGLSIGSNSSLNVSGGKLKISINPPGAASVGRGATASISGGGVLELAGSVSALGVASPAADRVAITNTSTAAAGLLVSNGNHQVGSIEGTGNVQVVSGASLTANSIIAGALVIGGPSGNPAKVTIATSDENGEPLGEGLASGTGDLAAAGFTALSTGPGSPAESASLPAFDASFDNPTSGAATPISQALHGDAVPEPSSIFLTFAGVVGLSSLVVRRRK